MRKLFHRQNTFKYMALAMAVMLSLSIVSCSKDEPTPVTPPEMPTPNEPVKPEEKKETITLSASSLSFPCEDFEILFNFEASNNWDASVYYTAHEWLSVSSGKGTANEKTIHIKLQKNDSPQDRSGIITFVCGDAKETITINQEGWKAQTGSAPQYVDLGLVNHEGKTVYWSTTNLNANSPCEAGPQYYYGMVQPNESNAHLGNSLFNKYAPDKLTELLPEDDPVTVRLGGNWRLPNEEDLWLLIGQCYWLWVTEYDGKNVPGYIVYKAKDNADRGKRPQFFNEAAPAPVATYSISDPHIFLPVGKTFVFHTIDGVKYDDYAGFYMSSSIYSTEYFYGLSIFQENADYGRDYIFDHSYIVRPVYVE